MNERNLVDLFLNQSKRFQGRAALRAKSNGRYHDISWNQFRSYVIRIALALNGSKVEKGERIALLSENRPEWPYTDLAILSLGAVTVPIYPTASIIDVEHILNHCEARILFVSTVDQLARISPARSKLAPIEKIIVFESCEQKDGVISLEDFIRGINSEDEENIALFQSFVERTGLDDLATIIYTSGTTGPAKGVMLSHRNFLVNCSDARRALPISDQDIFLSFLPLSHVFERMAGYYLCIFCGGTIAYAENMNTVPENLVEVKPTFSCGVPRFFEKMFAKIQAKIDEGSALAKAIFKWAVQIGKESSKFRMVHRALPFFLKVQFLIAKKLVYNKVYNRLGGRLRTFISGSAPLSKDLAEFFYSVGVLILEGYGLTETSPVISCNRFERFKFGSVGLPLDHVEVRIAEDGEILTRGPHVMVGYYKDEGATQKAIENGWFHTGDLGRIDSDGFLFIIGRKKDIIKTSGGKMVSPQNIENLILVDTVFSQVVLVGDKHHFITALIVPNFDQLRVVFKSRGRELEERPQDIVQNPLVHRLIRERLEERTKELASFEKIKYFTLLAREFSQEKGEMTITLKIKRSAVAANFHGAIEKMYRETENQANEGRDRIFFVL